MFRIAKLTDYGLVIMAELGSQPGKLYQSNELAAITGIKPPTVAKLLKILTKAGLTQSVRGVSGGYKLAKQATDISVADIIAAIEGPIALMECNSDETNCALSDICNIRSPWNKINQVVSNALNDLKLTDLHTREQKPLRIPLHTHTGNSHEQH